MAQFIHQNLVGRTETFNLRDAGNGIYYRITYDKALGIAVLRDMITGFTHTTDKEQMTIFFDKLRKVSFQKNRECSFMLDELQIRALVGSSRSINIGYGGHQSWYILRDSVIKNAGRWHNMFVRR